MTRSRWGLQGVCAAVLAVPGGCDDQADDGGDEGDGRDVPVVVDGCPDDDDLVDIGQTRSCVCDDGTESMKTCLSTGEFADCQCVGGGW